MKIQVTIEFEVDSDLQWLNPPYNKTLIDGIWTAIIGNDLSINNLVPLDKIKITTQPKGE